MLKNDRTKIYVVIIVFYKQGLTRLFMISESDYENDWNITVVWVFVTSSLVNYKRLAPYYNTF